MRNRAVLFCCAALFVATSFAQPVDRTKPPQTPPIPSYKLPPMVETALPNGLALELIEDPRFPLVTARLNFAAGSRFDPPELPGLAQAVASLLTEGTTTRTSHRISEEVDSIGGTLSATAGPDSLTVGGNALSEDLGKLLNLIADVALRANFPAGEVGLYKRNRAESLKAERADSAFLAAEKTSRLVYGTTPYAHIVPTPLSLSRIDEGKLVSFRDTHLIPANAMLILLGRLPSRDEVMKMITREFAAWPKRVAPAPAKIVPPAPHREIVLVDRPGSVQADIHVSRIAPPRTAADFFPLLVANSILGGGASSRLFRDVRERDGYAYDAHSEYDTNRDASTLSAVTEVRNEVLEPALREVLAEMDAMAAQPVSPAELAHVKDYMSGLYLLRLETQEGIAAQLNAIRTLGLPKDYLEKYTTNVRAVGIPQLQVAARRYIAPAQSFIVVVGDAGKIGDTLKKFGTVRIEAEQ